MDIVTLVPAFKPQYLPDLLSCLRLQTRPSCKIIFSDDSPRGVYGATLMSDALGALREGLNIECYPGPRRGAYPNIINLLNLWAGSSALVHILLDDDVIYPDFYNQHLVAHSSSRFSCTISRRWQASNKGQPQGGLPVPPAVALSPHRILSLDADVVFMTSAAMCVNWFGEFSNAIFRADIVPILQQPMFEGVSYAGLWDLGGFMAASLISPIGHIQDHLGYFRTGGGSNSDQFNGPYMKAALLAHGALILGGQRLGRYSASQACNGMSILARMGAYRYGSQGDMQPFIAVLTRLAAGEARAEDHFIDIWHTYLRQHDFF